MRAIISICICDTCLIDRYPGFADPPRASQRCTAHTMQQFITKERFE